MKLSKICIGGMRFTSKENAAAVIRKAIDCGFNYIDTSPAYCRGEDNIGSEEWVGEALQDPRYRDRVMVSTKCAPGNGGMELGEFKLQGGFGVRSADELQQMFDQSLERMKLPRVDWYHLWTTHTMEQFNEAMKPGGWYDGVMANKDRWTHLGITTHADTETALEFLKTGRFEAVTIPLNVINTARLRIVDYCNEHNIDVIAMNPMAGGFLAHHEELKELALRYLMRLDVHLLCGFAAVEEVEYAKWIEDTMDTYTLTAEEILERVDELVDASEERCTACGYCTPCPQNIIVGSALSYYNLYKYMHMPEARKAFQNKQWESSLALSNCVQCGLCEERCPNKLPVLKIITDALDIMYEKEDPDSQLSVESDG